MSYLLRHLPLGDWRIGTRLSRSLSVSMPLPSESYHLPRNWLDIKAVTTHVEPTNMYTVLIHQKNIACNERKQITLTGHLKETTIKHVLSKQRTVFPRTRNTTELIPRHYCFAPANWKRHCRVPTEQRKTLWSSW